MTVRKIRIPELEDAPAPKNMFWADEDKAVVIQYYGRKETRSIAKYLKRPITQITAQALKMGIYFNSTQKDRDTLIAKLGFDEP